MKAFFDRDGRKSNTIDIPESGQCPKTGLEICANMWSKSIPCTECQTFRRSVEYRTISLMIPIHELTLNTGDYHKFSEWACLPKDKMPSEDMVTIPKAEYKALISGKNWLMPESSRQKILLAIDALKDALTEEESVR